MCISHFWSRAIFNRVLICLGCLLLSTSGWALPDVPAKYPTVTSKEVRVGVAPHTSARAIIEMYQPLRRYLERTLSVPVVIVTATDFTEFVRRALDQKYDIVITTGHQAQLLVSDARYLPLLTYKADFKALALVAKKSPYRKPSDLAGTVVAGLSPSSLVTLWGQHWLHNNKVSGVRMKYVSAADSTAQLVVKGESAVAFHSLANYQSLDPSLQGELRILDESPPMVGRVYLLNARHAALREMLVSSLWAFSETAEAKSYFEHYGLHGYRSVSLRELQDMEPYAKKVRSLLQEKK